MANCEYCCGDQDGWVLDLPKIRKCNGNATVIKSAWGSKLLISLPFKTKCEYEIKYCPMCGEKLNNFRKL